MTTETTGAEPREAFVQAGGVRLHYMTWGEQSALRTLVCLHGSGGNGWHWGPLARAMVPLGYRVLAFDQRGHGDSDQPETGYQVEDFVGDMEAVHAALGLGQFDLLGASLGSRVALMYGAKHADQVRRLVLVDLSFDMPVVEQQRMIDGHRTRPMSFDSPDEVMAYSRNSPGRARWSPEMHDEMALREVKQAADGRWVWRYSPQSAIQGLEVARRNMWPLAESLTMPTLVVRGAESPVLTPESAEEMKQRIPGCQLVEIENAGHGIPRDNPASFNRAVADFLTA